MPNIANMTRFRTTHSKLYKYRRVVLASSLAAGISLGCSGTDSSPTGGTISVGGNGGSSGTSTGGAATGGQPSGGTTAIGGTTSTTGGNANTGGVAFATGGTTSSGGTTTATGGSKATGGTASATGGTPATGGTTSATGGSKATGGVATGSTPATGGNASTGGTGDPSSILVPAQGALLGAFIGSPATVASRETLLGRKLAIIQNYFGWADNWVAGVPGVLSGGRIPLITWIPNSSAGAAISLNDIINGLQDTYITSRAQAAKAVGGKFFLRWGHEMNGNWTNWNASKYGSNAAGAALFAQAWQHIHSLFTAAGATTVLWVFCPNVNSVPVATWNTWQSYYPGDAYVDWMSFDGYNFGTGAGGYGWVSFAAVTNGTYSSLAATGKPIMIAEMSSSETGATRQPGSTR